MPRFVCLRICFWLLWLHCCTHFLCLPFVAFPLQWFFSLWVPGSGTQAQESWCTGLDAPWQVGSSRTRSWTRVPCTGRRILICLYHQGSPCFVLIDVWAVLSHSVESDSLRPRELQPARLLCHGIFQARTLEWVAIYLLLMYSGFKM